MSVAPGRYGPAHGRSIIGPSLLSGLAAAHSAQGGLRLPIEVYDPAAVLALAGVVREPQLVTDAAFALGHHRPVTTAISVTPRPCASVRTMVASILCRRRCVGCRCGDIRSTTGDLRPLPIAWKYFLGRYMCQGFSVRHLDRSRVPAVLWVAMADAK